MLRTYKPDKASFHLHRSGKVLLPVSTTNILSSYINFCWEIEKRRWNRKKLHHDLILCNHFESYQRICLIFMDTHLSPVLWCFCNRIINNIWAEQFFRFRCNRDLFMAASTWQVDWLLLWIICAHDLIYVWTISLALIFKHLAGWVNLVWM